MLFMRLLHAKGFQVQWEPKSVEESQRLSIYTPERISEALRAARVICAPPEQAAAEQIGSEELLGEWLHQELERGDESVRHLVRRESPDGRAQPKLTYTECVELPGVLDHLRLFQGRLSTDYVRVTYAISRFAYVISIYGL